MLQKFETVTEFDLVSIFVYVHDKQLLSGELKKFLDALSACLSRAIP